MQTYGNLTASYLWQPGEFARRMLGERPSPVPPTRELWPAPQLPMSISTLHVAYEQEAAPRRAATLPPQSCVTAAPVHYDHRRHVCTVGTNTDPPPTVLSRLKTLVKRQNEDRAGPPPGRLTAVRELTPDTRGNDNAAKRALSGLKKAISGAKYRIAPNSESVESPKIVYEVPKPGDRMTRTFGAGRSRRWCQLGSRAAWTRRVRLAASWCRPTPPPPPRRDPPPPLQITQV